MNEIEGEQTEDFEIHEQVLNNLTPEEKVFYKLKVSKPMFTTNSMKNAVKILAIAVVVTQIILIIIRGVEKFFTSPFVLFSLIYIPIGLIGFWFLFTKVGNKPIDEHLYLTNKNLFKIYGGSRGGNIKTILLEDIQAISYIKTKRYAKTFDIEIISEQINYYSRYSKGRSYNFPVLIDLPKNIIEKMNLTFIYLINLAIQNFLQPSLCMMIK
jgi:ABC-type multidrug transport system fused ATPase/permease subunit